MSRLASLSTNPTLLSYSQGAAQRAIRAVANFLAPTCEVATLTGKFKIYDQKHRFHIPETKRGIGGRANRIGFNASDGNYNVEPHALDFPIDNLEKIDGDGALMIGQEGADMLADVSGLAHERDVVTAALAALGAGTDENFLANGFDPVDAIDALIMNVMKASKNGAPIKVLFGATAWRRTKNNAEVKKRLVSNRRSDVASVNMGAFRSLLFSEPEIDMSLMVQDEAPEGVDEDIQFLLDDEIIVFASNDSPTRLSPDFMKTFRLRGQWMVPGTYPTEDGRGEVLKMDWSEEIQVTNSAAAARLNAKDA